MTDWRVARGGWCVAGCLLVGSLGLGGGMAAGAHPVINSSMAYEDYAGIWVTRFDYSSEAQVRSIIADAASLGFTDIQFQVRGQGDARYESNFEVWPQQSPYFSSNPGWDPLAVAVDEAQKNGVRLHAWLNTIPMWNGSSAPVNPDHLWNAHPEWRLKDFNGNDQPLFNGYVGINPTVEAAQDHIANVAADIVANYDVDGIHLDYVRMISGAGSTYVQDPASRAHFTADTGLAFSGGSSAHKQWIADHITELVVKVRDQIKAIDQDQILSAAIWRDFNIALNSHQQHAERWIEEEILDLALPMTYLSDQFDYLLESNVQMYAGIGGSTAVVTGLGPYLHGTDTALTMSQIERARDNGSHGFQIYAYSTIRNAGPMRTAIADYLASLGPAPEFGVIADFEGGAAPFGGDAEDSIYTWQVNNSTNMASTQSAIDGTQSLRLDVDGGTQEEGGWVVDLLADETDPFAATGWVGFWVKTASENATVALTVNDSNGFEVSVEQALTGDGVWRLVQWDLDDPDSWYAQSPRSGTGQIDGSEASLRSLRVTGEGVSWLLFDRFAHDPEGMLDPWLGDFNGNGGYSLVDLNMIASGMGTPDYDLTGDGTTTADDLRFWVEELFGSRLGDTNLDGSVDLLDLSLLAASFGQSGKTWANGDFDGNGSVDLIDLSLMAGSFGFGQAVPEPVTALGLAGGLVLMRRRG
ncbi:glycoside hydrolase family 10 protein [Mucisphaera sp.]|uniref:glycoside hydrolase family 10 protein n=1 Tax=Mucisphaera sp. TaxID=2913024 RepID=UPI003D0EA7AC